MSAPGQQPDPRQALIDAGLDAGRVLASKAAGAQSAAEAKDFAGAALALAQAIAAVDTGSDGQGTPLSHHDALETTRAAAQLQVAETQGQFALELERMRGEHALEVARVNAAAKPAPAKEKTVSVTRDGSGRAAEYKVKG